MCLEVNPSKCELFTIPATESQNLQQDTLTILAQIELALPNVKSMNRSNLLLLGAPIFEEAIDTVLLEKLDDLKRMREKLVFIDPHDVLFLLRGCYAIPKLTYCLRSAPTFKSMATLKLYDQEMKECLEEILNIRLDEQARDQCSLPVKQGGFGIQMASDIALPCFLSSGYGAALGASNLLPNEVSEATYADLDAALSAWKERIQNTEEEEQPLPENLTVQAPWDQPLYELKFKQLLDKQTTPSEKARLPAVSSPHASDWLLAYPLPTLELKLDSTSLQMSCALRLGSPIFKPFKCICGTIVDSSGRHGLSCQKVKGTYPRHLLINKILGRDMARAQVTATLEQTNLCQGDGKQPDGLTLLPWTMGRHLVWDVTCRDTLCQSYVYQTSKLAKLRKKEKRKKSSNIANWRKII